MYSDPFSSTTPAAAGINNPDCVKWRETLPSQVKSAGRDIPMGQLVTKVLVSRESPLPPCQLWPGRNSPVPGVESPVPTGVHTLAWTPAGWVLWEPPEKKLVAFGADEPDSSEPAKGLKEGVFQMWGEGCVCRGEEDGCREGGGKLWYFFFLIHLFNYVVRSFLRSHAVYV